MTDKPTPTDAELEALLLAKLPASKHYIRPVIEKMVAAMQAAIDKWGQPAQETNGRKVFVCTHCDGVYADQPVTQCDCLPDENTFTEGWICFGAPAQAAEPFCWHWENTFNGGTGTVKKNPETLGINMSHPAYKWTALYTTPQPTQTQPVAREPLTPEQIERDRPMMVEPAAYAAGVRYAEKHHGIKGGQHGTE